jgi:four helix bundle protein
MRNFHELKIWEKSHALTLEIYEITRGFPKEELYGLTSQIRRSAASIPTNIAEGCGRNSEPEFIHFLQIAMGSTNETEYLLLLSQDLGFISPESFQILHNKLIEIKKMLSGFLQQLRIRQRK